MNIKSRLAELNVPDVLAPFGKKITVKEEFELAKEGIKRLLQEEEYGYIPDKPEHLYIEKLSTDEGFAAGRAIITQYVMHAIVRGQEVTFPFASIVPKRDGRIQTFVHIDFTPEIPSKGEPTEEIIDRGYAIFKICYRDVTSDDGDFTNGVAKILGRKRNTANAPGKIAIWAWSIMRVIDFIETLDLYNPDALAVIGHSRLGKTTLLAAAFDERIKFACVNNSGTCGDALSRGTRGETVADITRVFPYWFCPNFLKYANNENSLPFDQHFLISLVAPRCVLCGTAKQDVWADPYSQFLSLTLTDGVYRLYGVNGLVHTDEIPEAPCKLQDGNCSFHTTTGKHYLGREDWNNYMDFIDEKLKQMRI